MADLYLTPAERYTAALGGFYYGDLPEPGTVYTQLIKDILDGSTPDKEPKNVLARFIYSLYISDLGDPYPRYELAKLLYWKLHDIAPTKVGSILTVTIDGKEDYITINTDLSRLWYKVLFGSKTDVITEFPYTFNTMQNKLSNWELFGNTVQSGTPSPDSPVMPQGTGERTGNLFDSTLINGYFATAEFDTSGDVSVYKSIKVFLTAGTYTFSWGKNVNVVRLIIDGNYSQPVYTDVSSHTITSTTDGYVGISFRDTTSSTTVWDITTPIMLNSGSTALPYEPYGYKIPISSAGQTTPIYLSEVQTTRKIKKLVFDGTEDWKINAKAAPPNNIAYIALDNVLTGIAPICTHYVGTDKNTWLSLQLNDITVSIISGSVIRCAVNIGGTILNDFKAYLAAQYAAGTPVTVWYVLAESEVGVVNEPLMKIGDYADSVSMLETGIDIPTVIGQNTLDVLTTVKPSSMSIEYTSADENKSRSKRISLLKRPLSESIKI